MMKGVWALDRRRQAVMMASPAAMPSEPPRKSKSCTAATISMLCNLPKASFTASEAPVFQAVFLEPVGVAFHIAEF